MVRRRVKDPARRISGWWLALVLGVVGLAGATWLTLDHLRTEIRTRFDGRRWSLPAIVYAQPRELYPGLALTPEELEAELELAGYRPSAKVEGAGSYKLVADTIHLVSRDFPYPSGFEPGQAISVSFAAGKIAALADESGNKLPLVRLDPVRIGSFHPLVHEDRLLVSRAEIPSLLIDTLLAVEDRNFSAHFGVEPMAIVRALIANLAAGRTVQGGSTLTQQLVKNLFLTSERTWSRKAREAVMAILLERQVSKEEILTTYINEVYLGQDDNRAIHGFGLASQFYFRSELADLRADQLALLVGLVKGPSAYDPRRRPEESRQRRDLVLAMMRERGLIGENNYRAALARPVMDVEVQKNGFNRFPAFLDLVRQQLAGEYKEDDLKGGGLRILTTLDPRLQLDAEDKLRQHLRHFDSKHQDGQLEGAVVITRRETGEILALVGGKLGLPGGFNRALKAKRQIGSLIKPVVYLTALRQGYGLADPLDDSAVTLDTQGGKEWRPQNYDRREHGTIPLYLALARSYNLATVRLGLAVGLEPVAQTLADLGYPGAVERYPSLLLGAIEMTPLEVTQIYQTIAAGGFLTNLRAIDSVIESSGGLLTRYGLEVTQRIEPEPVFLLTHALQRVVSEGTASNLLSSPLRRHFLAGKTGTTDDLRDSWFAGFSDDHLGVVWVGRDDNSATGLTGASGALPVWRAIMEKSGTSPLMPVAPETIAWIRVANSAASPSVGGESETLLPVLASALPETPVGEAPPAGSLQDRGSGPQGGGSSSQGGGSFFDTLGDWFNSWK